MVSSRGRDPLAIWMNNELVGTWSMTRANVEMFSYENEWLNSPRSRPLSLTLPFLPGNEPHRGNHVESWFENLLPDALEIRRRIARRFGVHTDPRSLLEQIGRDCVGAVQILPTGDPPSDNRRLDAKPLTNPEVARTLRRVTSDARFLEDRADEFRISVAGAQEKTALLQLGGQWHQPSGSTPTTHILKLPLGIVGDLKLDLSHSIENEWLCLQLLRAMGLDAAVADMATFADDVGEERVLVVERFDREWRDDNTWIARVPQEDFCQATGTRPNRKYENEGGPGISAIAGLLRAGSSPEEDLRLFVLAQLAYWLLAALDGHAKNFSVFLRRDGYVLTPLYDVMSAWPVIGHGVNKIPIQHAKVALAVKCKTKRYEIDRISTRHWGCLAAQTGVKFEDMQRLVETVPNAIATVEANLPKGFPESVWVAITEGMRSNARIFTS